MKRLCIPLYIPAGLGLVKQVPSPPRAVLALIFDRLTCGFKSADTPPVVY